MNDPASMNGKTCLVTGSSSGHGRAVAEELALRGADVIVHGPRESDCMGTVKRIASLTGKDPSVLACDFSSKKQIGRAAAEFLSWKRPLHLLVNNAGLVSRDRTLSEDGFELTFAVNYLAMFQFTLLVLPRLAASAPARIVNVSSETLALAAIDLDDLDARGKRYSFMGAYGRSKLAVMYFTRELARRTAGTGVTVNAVDPGPMATEIARKPGLLPLVANAIIQLTFPRPARAARTALHCALSPELEGVTGKYFRFMKMKEPKLSATDPPFGALLWEKSAAITGADYRVSAGR